MTFEEILPGLKAKKKYVRKGWGGAENYVQLFDSLEQNGVALEVTPYFALPRLQRGLRRPRRPRRRGDPPGAAPRPSDAGRARGARPPRTHAAPRLAPGRAPERVRRARAPR